jgi:hypothetical protein
VVITAPTSEATYDVSTAMMTSLAGTCTDDISVSSVTWVNSGGGSGTATGTTTWSVPSITLASGANTITVTCTDGGSNTGTDVLTVTYTPTGPPARRLRLGWFKKWLLDPIVALFVQEVFIGSPRMRVSSGP